MKKTASGGTAVAERVKPAPDALKEAPPLPKPLKEHEWLGRLVGKWHATLEMFKEPGRPPEKSEGSETVRTVGGFWIVSEYTGTFMEQPFRGLLTLGYDPGSKSYVGTWIGSMESQLWTYEGTLDPTGNILTLETEGACAMAPGKPTRFREVIELKDKDHRRFISSMLGDDGKWVTTMICNYTRSS